MQLTTRYLSDFMNRCQNRYFVTANNLANVNTDGFKKSLMVERGANQTSVVDPSDGALRSTNNPLDLSIKGDGYFAVKTAAGTRYTRDGKFQLDDKQRLVTERGETVLDDKGQPIVLSSGNAKVSSDGEIYSGETKLGKLAVVKPAEKWGVVNTGNGTVNFQPVFAKANEYNIASGTVESSNVDPLTEMVESIDVFRDFEMAQRLMKIEDGLAEKNATQTGNSNP